MAYNYNLYDVHTLKVLSLNLDNTTEQHYLLVQDDHGVQYRVKPFHFQVDWSGEIDTVDCVVCGVDGATGKPRFCQRKLDVLEQFYEVGNPYPFIVREKCQDPNGAPYYMIEDNILEISQRYYTNAPHEVGDFINLTVSEIFEGVKRDAYLKFEPEGSRVKTEKSNRQKDFKDIEQYAEERAKVGGCEGQCVEWKSSIAFVAGQIEANIDKQLSVILKIIAAFQNSVGGDLYIGVNDNGIVSGIEYDFPYLNTGSDVEEGGMVYGQTLDSYQLKIHNAVQSRLGAMSNANVSVRFAKEGGLYYCIVSVKPTVRPVYLDGTRLYQRAGNMCQRLKGDDITNFVLDRERLFGQIQLPNAANAAIDYVAKEKEAEVLPQIAMAPASTDRKPRFYMQFYTDGTWSYSKSKSGDSGIRVEVPIYAEDVKGSLLMCYDNGRVNRVDPYKFLKPVRTSGKRAWKTQSRRYSNGLYPDANLLAIYSCSDADRLAIFCKDTDGVEWVKIHSLDAITTHGSTHNMGNQVVMTGSTDVSYALIKAEKYHFVSALAAKDYQLTTSNGQRRKNIQLKSTFEQLEKLMAI